MTLVIGSTSTPPTPHTDSTPLTHDERKELEQFRYDKRLRKDTWLARIFTGVFFLFVVVFGVIAWGERSIRIHTEQQRVAIERQLIQLVNDYNALAQQTNTNTRAYVTTQTSPTSTSTGNGSDLLFGTPTSTRTMEEVRHARAMEVLVQPSPSATPAPVPVK